MLMPAEEIMLGIAVQRGQLPEAIHCQKRAGKRAGKRAKERMIKANLRFVMNVSRKYMHRQMGQLESGDLN